jgi:hypothetical protein
MKLIVIVPALSALAVLLTACHSMPTNTTLLEQARSEYLAAQSNPKVATYAPAEMKQASTLYAQVNASADHGDSPDKVNKLAAQAKQQLIMVQEIAKQKATEADFAVTGKDCNQLRLQ